MSEREEFEKWAVTTLGKYTLSEPDAGSMWCAWQAARAPLLEQLERLKDEACERDIRLVGLRAQVERLRKDAERYRWLRDDKGSPIELSGETLDSLIDAALEPRK
jgi:hypothetical protein